MPDGGISNKSKKPTTPNHALQHGWALSVMIFIFNDTSLQASFYLHLDKVGFSIPMLVVSIFFSIISCSLFPLPIILIRKAKTHRPLTWIWKRP